MLYQNLVIQKSVSKLFISEGRQFKVDTSGPSSRIQTFKCTNGGNQVINYWDSKVY